MKHIPFIIIISSPSGAGKTTITKAILQNDPCLKMSISTTTRPKRENEIDGKDYFFVNSEKFEQMLKNGEFLEYAKVYDKSYGSTKRMVSDLQNQGFDVIFDIDWQGMVQLKEILNKQVVTIYILPPSLKDLEHRLRSRNSDAEEAIITRLAAAKKDISHWQKYDYVVVNENIEQATEMVKSIINVERLKRSGFEVVAKELLNE